MRPPDGNRITSTPPRAGGLRRAITVAVAVLVIGCVWRAVVGLVVVPAWEARAGVGNFPDAYPRLARTWIETGTLGYGDAGANPTTARGPGWPLWLAAGMLLGCGGPRGIALWAALPGLLGGGAIGFLLARRYGALAGIVGGLAAVLHPLPAIASARAMGDEFYGVLSFAGLALFFAAVAARGVRSVALALASGGALALQMLTRATGVLSLVALGTGAACKRRPRAGLLALVGVVALVPALAWSVRSSRLEGRPVFVHSLLGYNFWFGDAYHRLGASRSAGEIRTTALRRMAQLCPTPVLDDPEFWYVRLTPGETAKLERCLLAAAGRSIRNDPLDYLERFALGLGRFWIGADDPGRSMQYAWIVAPLLGAALLGAVRVARRGIDADPLGWSLVLLVVLHDVAYAATWPMARLSVQVYPALAYLAGVGLARFAPRSSGALGDGA